MIPTLCDFAGIEKPSHLLGYSVRPLTEGRHVDTWRESVVVESDAARMIRTARFKYVVYEKGERRESLVDLTEDPGEMKNLATNPDYRETLNKHRQLLSDWIKRTGDTIGQGFVIPPEN